MHRHSAFERDGRLPFDLEEEAARGVASQLAEVFLALSPFELFGLQRLRGCPAGPGQRQAGPKSQTRVTKMCLHAGEF